MALPPPDPAIGAIHGFGSKPLIALNEDGIQIKGWLMPSSNADIKWEEVASARVTTDAAQNKVIWLTDKTGKVKLIESVRYEGFGETGAFIQKKLAEKGIEIAAVTLPSPN